MKIETIERIKTPMVNTTFGLMLQVPHPDDADVMIVCVNNGFGLKPVRLCLLHQLYDNSIDELLKQYPDTQSITCIPCKSDNYVEVWDRKKEVKLPSKKTAKGQAVA